MWPSQKKQPTHNVAPDGERDASLCSCLERTARRLSVLKADDPLKRLDDIEEALSHTLNREWTRSATKAAGGAEKLLARIERAQGQFAEVAEGQDRSDDEIQRVLDDIENNMSALFPASASSAVMGLVSSSYLYGRNELLQGQFGFSPVWRMRDSNIDRMMRENTMYWVGSYYDAQLGKEIAGLVKEYVGNRELSRREAGKLLAADLKERFGRSDQYWQGLSAQVVSRASNFGAIETMAEAGIVEYEIVSRRLRNTCQYCLEMDGRIFKVSDGKAMVDSFLSAKNPEEAKTAHPWIVGSDFQDKIFGKSSTWLGKKKFSLPPYHFHCWCSVVARVSTDEASIVIGDDVDKMTATYGKNITGQEWQAKTDNLRGDVYDPARKEEDFETHVTGGPKSFQDRVSDKAGVPSQHKYTLDAKKSVRGADQIFFMTEEGRGSFVAINREGGTITRANGAFVWGHEYVGNDMASRVADLKTRAIEIDRMRAAA